MSCGNDQFDRTLESLQQKQEQNKSPESHQIRMQQRFNSQSSKSNSERDNLGSQPRAGLKHKNSLPSLGTDDSADAATLSNHGRERLRQV